jgi:hypothetical protein
LPQRWDWRLLAAQDQPPPKPTFKSAVRRGGGRRQRHRQERAAGDFTLTVDGKPRRAVSAQFISVDRAVDRVPASKPMEDDFTPERRAVAW